MDPGSVCVTIVTYNSRRYIRRCLQSVIDQTGAPLEVVVVDNASEDGTRAVLEGFEDVASIIYNECNTGFAAAQNQAIARSSSEWVLALNPDVLLEPGFIRRLVQAGSIDPRVGSVCGKLLSIGPDFRPPPERRIDSAGIYFTRSMRHFDRGWNEPDDGRFDVLEYVFGASGAAALYRRAMIEDISMGDGFFDPDFFAYREDADVAWRAQLLGWRCVYAPDAVAHHVRRVVPGVRAALPASLNMHSVKNRFLLRIKNATPRLSWKCCLPALARDALVIGGCLLWEQSSLPAFWALVRRLPGALRKRRQILARQRVSDRDLARWFLSGPAGEPVPRLVRTAAADHESSRATLRTFAHPAR
jgi:GT2 family glycosyltransferase